MFRIFYTNFCYFASETFGTLDMAIAYGKSKGFEFNVSQNGHIVYTWSPITGGRMKQ